MRKLKLDVDALTVEEFTTTGGEAKSGGTVRAHDSSFPAWNCPVSWNGYCADSMSGEYACHCIPPEL